MVFLCLVLECVSLGKYFFPLWHFSSELYCMYTSNLIHSHHSGNFSHSIIVKRSIVYLGTMLRLVEWNWVKRSSMLWMHFFLLFCFAPPISITCSLVCGLSLANKRWQLTLWLLLWLTSWTPLLGGADVSTETHSFTCMLWLGSACPQAGKQTNIWKKNPIQIWVSVDKISSECFICTFIHALQTFFIPKYNK